MQRLHLLISLTEDLIIRPAYSLFDWGIVIKSDHQNYYQNDSLEYVPVTLQDIDVV